MNLPFPSGPPPTPEEQAAVKKQRAQEHIELSKSYQAALPHLRAALASIREASRLGVGGARCTKARHHLALLIEDLEDILERPL